ncbi:MAG: TonB-dependent receptor plug domain-containing protein [Sulfuricurvum sp.]
MHPSVLSLTAASALLFTLEANELILEPIVVSATKTEQPLSQVSADVGIITAQELEERHFTSLGEALSTLGGINMTQSGGLGNQSAIYLRGLANKYTLVLIDGIRVNDPSNFDGALFDQISLSDIERIEVIKGAQSGVWGADAAAGVINIITKTAKPHHVAAYAEAGSYNTRKTGASLSHATDKADFKIGFDRVMTDGFSAAEPKRSSPLYGERFDSLGWERDGYAATTVQGKAGINLSNNDRIELSHRHLSSHVEFDSSGADQPLAVVSSPWGNSYYANDFTQRFTKASYSHTFVRGSIDLYAQRSDFKRSYYGGYEGKTDEGGLNGTFQYAPGASVTAGAVWQNFDVGNVAGSSVSKDYTGKGVFVSNTNLFNGGRTLLSETLRTDDYTIFGSKTTGKIGVRQNLTGDLSLSANYGTAYKVPSLSDIYPPSSWWMSANTDLKPETIRSYDVTATYGNASLTYFHSAIENMIAINSTYTQMINLTGTSTLHGVEASLRHNFGDSVSLYGAYTRLLSEDATGKDLPRRPGETLYTSLDWHLNERLRAGVNAQYIGTRYDNAAQTVSTGNYAVFGGVLNYALSTKVDLYAKLDNLFNRYYQTVDGYATAGFSGYFGVKIDY